MPAPVQDYTNGELMDVIEQGSEHFLFTACVTEMNNRINAVTDLRAKKGFDTPNPPQIP